MAKQVEDIVVRLVGEGFEALDKIKGSFRELGKVTNLAEKDILSARDSLLDYARKAGNTEAVNKGLGDAFKGLRSQVDMCSDAYRVLSADLRQIDEVSRGATQSVMAQRDAVLASTAAGTQNVAALQRQLAALVSLRAQTREASTAFDQFSQDIQQVETRLDSLADVNRRFNATLVQSTAATAAGARVQLEALTAGIALRRQEIADIDTRSARERRLRTTIEERLGLEERLNTALSIRRRIQFQEGARTGRESARTGAATFNDPTVTAGFLAPDRIAQRLGDLPNTTAGLSQELGELNERLINTYRNTETYIQVQLRLAAVQRDVTSATQGFGAALLADLNAGIIIPSQKNLAEVIGQLRREMLELDQTTTEGTRAYAQNAAEVDRLQQQLDKLAGAYRSVSAASRGATSQGNSRVTVGGERPFVSEMDRQKQRRDAAMAQREEFEQLTAAADASGLEAVDALLSAKRTLAEAEVSAAQKLDQLKDDLHAKDIQRVDELFAKEVAAFDRKLQLDKRAQQIAATKQEMGFFAQSELSPFYSSVAEMGGAREARQQQFMGRSPSQVLDDIATSFSAGGVRPPAPPVPPVAGGGPSPAANTEFTKLNATLTKFGALNRRSITDIKQLGGMLDELKDSLSPLDDEYRQVNKSIEAQQVLIERELGRRERRQRRAPSTGQLVQAGGAAISGGIFGGPEGFLGGVGGAVLGTALPGIGTAGGAFAGAAAGAQVGMFRQQLAGTADYAASIGKLQIALRGVVGSQEAYDAAIRAAAAATRDLNIPQEEATRGLTRLSAAVIGAGGTVADSSFAFRAMSEAIKATGGNAEQVDGALLALTQVFSKGKVSAEELNQIAERLPGTFTLFAQAAGKTGPELQKALEQGEVGLNDLMKFLALTGERYGATALEIAGSSQDAGARLTVAFQAMRLEVGKALQPLGAELQGAFATFISEITPAVVGSAKALAAAISFFADNKAAAGLATFAFQVGAVALAIKGLQAAYAGLVALNIASWFTGAATGIKITGDAAAVAAPKVGLLRGALGGLVALAAKPIVITIVIAGVIEAIKRIGDVNTAFAEFLKTRKELTGGSWLSSVGGGALSTKELSGLATEVSNAYNFNAAELKRLEQQKSIITLQQNTDATSGAELAALNNRLIAVNTGIETAKKRMASAKSKLDAIYGQLNAPKPVATTTGTNFPDPTGDEDKDKQARDKARRDAEAAAAEQQRYLESFMQQQIRVADTVFQHQQDLDRQRFDLLKELTDIEAQNRINKLFGPEREAANIQEQRRQRSLDYENRILTAMNAVAAAQQKLSGAQRMATVTAGAGLSSSTGVPSIGGFTPQQLSSATTAASKFTGIANMCSESVKAFYKSLGITLPGVTAWADTVRKSGQVMTDWSKLQAGDIVATGRPGDTPHVGVYTGGNNVFHQSRKRGLTAGNYPDLDYFRGGYFVRPTAAAGGRQATGVAAQQRRNVTDTGDVALAGLDVTQAEATLANLTAQRDRFNAAFNQEQINALTASLTTQNYELEKTITLETKRFDLVRKGYSEERIALEQKFDQAKIARDAALTGVTPGDDSQVLAINTAYERQIELLQQLYDAQTQFNNSFGAGFQTGVQQYVQSLGTMNQAAAQLTQTGLKGIEDTLFSLVTTGKANFREFAAEILKQSARMILQLTIQQIIMQIIGAIGGGGAPSDLGSSTANLAQYAPLPNAMGNAFAKNNIVPYAMGGVVSKPTLFKFANGGTTRTGLMGEAGPEAIMPLKRGPGGKLGVMSSGGGGGTTNVTVNVDASGSKTQGDSAKSEQLGRAVSQAVQDELLRQRRPGGILA